MIGHCLFALCWLVSDIAKGDRGNNKRLVVVALVRCCVRMV